MGQEALGLSSIQSNQSSRGRKRCASLGRLARVRILGDREAALLEERHHLRVAAVLDLQELAHRLVHELGEAVEGDLRACRPERGR